MKYKHILLLVLLLTATFTITAQDSLQTNAPNTPISNSELAQFTTTLQNNIKLMDSVSKARLIALKDSSQNVIRIDSIATQQLSQSLANNIIAQPVVTTVNNIEVERKGPTNNFLFWAFIVLLLIPAVFRLINPSYFRNIFIAYKNPNLSTRQLKEQLRHNSLASLVMDTYFCAVVGFFLYAAIKPLITLPEDSIFQNQIQLFLIFVGLLGVIYTVKSIFLKFIGYLFHSEEEFEVFIFNIFLLNRIMAFVLLPTIALYAFGPSAWQQPLFLINLLVIAFFFIQRYIRSAASFNYLFKYSKFHFFLYLCTSEVMPILVLVKALSNFLKLLS